MCVIKFFQILFILRDTIVMIISIKFKNQNIKNLKIKPKVYRNVEKLCTEITKYLS